MSLKTVSQRLDVPEPRLNYLVHVDDIRRIAYFETPKVACTSIKKYMQDTYAGAPVKLETKNQVHDRQRSPLKTLRNLPDDEVDAVFEGDYKRFSFVRNPYTRTLSAYLDKIVTNQWERDRHLPMLGFERDAKVSFLEFLQAIAEIPDGKRDIHFTSQSSLLSTGQIDYDFLGAFERFDADFAHLKSALYDDAMENNYAAFGKHHATGASEKVLSYYGFAEQALVEKLYHADFETFGYVKDIDRSQEPPEFDGVDMMKLRARLSQLVRSGSSIKDAKEPDEEATETALKLAQAGHFQSAVDLFNRIDLGAGWKAGRHYQRLSELVCSLPEHQQELRAKLDRSKLKWLLNQGSPTCDGVPFLLRRLTPLWRTDPTKLTSLIALFRDVIHGTTHNSEFSTAETCLLCLSNAPEHRDEIFSALNRNFPYLTFDQSNFIFWSRNGLSHEWLQTVGLSIDSQTLNDQAAFNLLTAAAAFGTLEQFDAILSQGAKRSVDSTSAGIALVKIASARAERIAKAPTTLDKQKSLRIAVCISGQLRGYRNAFPSWRALGLESHEVDYFVHVWKDIGRKQPFPLHASRCFPQPLADVFARRAQEITPARFWENYPSLFDLFKTHAVVSQEEISNFYRTPHVAVEREDDLDFLDSNSDKMYYKIRECSKLMSSSNKKYDLVIRIRPDKALDTETPPPDWHNILEECARDQVIFVDGPSIFLPGPGFGIGDQFAVGTQEAMNAYSSAWEMHASEPKKLGFPRRMAPHTTLAYTCLYNGLFIKSLRPYFNGFKTPTDPDLIPTELMVEAIVADSKARNNEIDQELLSAAQDAADKELQMV